MGITVMKFGGSSVKDAESLRRVAKTVSGEFDKGNQVVVVVSAQGDTTDELIDKAKEITARPNLRDMDFLLATGEQISASLLCMALKDIRYKAVPLTGWQAGFLTSSAHGNARVRKLRSDRLRNELEKGNIVVVTGFQGINRYGDITTLGRGGSDTTAVTIAADLRAESCKIFTDVDGIYTADPRLVSGAIKLDSITYNEMLELASLGARVLHSRSVEMAKKYGVVLEILSSIENKAGTKVEEANIMEKMLIKGVTKDDSIARVTVTRLSDEPGVAFRLFSILANIKVNVDIILQTLGRDGTKDITFTIKEDEAERTLESLEEVKSSLGFETIVCNKNNSKVSIVGAGMESNHGVAAKMFEALSDANINIHMISTSEIKISVLIDRDKSDRAVKIVHDAFFEPNGFVR